MTAATLTLADFLLARIAEDEEAARPTVPGPWFLNRGREVIGGGPPRVICQPRSTGNAIHIARHDPARVLAECEAKRRIVTMVKIGVSAGPGYQSAVDDALHFLAAVYADHPDFRDEWRT